MVCSSPGERVSAEGEMMVISFRFPVRRMAMSRSVSFLRFLMRRVPSSVLCSSRVLVRRGSLVMKVKGSDG